MDIRTVDLSDEALKGIGCTLTPRQWAGPGPGESHTYVETNIDLKIEAPCSSGALECAPRPKTLARMERHLATREILIALEGESIVCVAPPQESRDGDLTGITAVRVRSGQGFIMEVGAWHWIPFPTGKTPARYMVIFRSGTGKSDLHFHDFKSPHNVRA